MELSERLPKAVGARYAVEGEIGRGGMAVVFRARDVRLERPVAIKVLEPDVAGEIGAERFLREVRLASQLMHPHILPVHESGESEGLLYYIMPFVEGESLRDRLKREGQLPLHDALRIARQVADALACAHGRGVIHRDIKPENILLSGETGHAMVADFGIARAVGEAIGETRLTATGLSVGTPAYMSPEQAAGERVLDVRTDLYALGTVLYEMLVGEPPFTGPTAQAVIAKRLAQPAPPIHIVRPAVPAQIAAAVARALEMVPADRFATADAFRAALEPLGTAWGDPGVRVAYPAPRDPTGTRAEVGHRSGDVMGEGQAGSGMADQLRRGRLALVAGAVIALSIGYPAYRYLGGADDPTRLVVLPFENEGLPEDDYLVDGITGELTNRLSGIQSIGVIARSSAVQYRHTRKTARDIGRELNVQYVIVGRVRRSRRRNDDDSVHIQVSLVRARDQTQLWYGNYPVGVRNVDSAQAHIAESVTDEMHVRLLPPERRRLAENESRNVRAYDYYLRGVDLYTRSWSRPDVEGAVEMYQRAVEIDTTYALAYAGLAQAHAWMHQLRYDVSEDRLIDAKRAADRALALDPELPEGHVALGLYYYWGRGNYERAIAEFSRAKELQPSNAEALLQIGNVRRRQGRFREAIESYRASAELDPRSHRAWFNLGETLLFIRDYEAARAPLDSVTVLAPEFLEGYIQRARLVMNSTGDVQGTLAILRQAEERIPPTAWRSAMLDFARIVYHPDLDEFLRRIRPGAYGLDSASYHVTKATMFVQVGRRDSAVAQFDSARVHLERMREDQPTEAWIHGLLGIAYAGLERSAEAIASSAQAERLLPVSQDALDGPDWIIQRAKVHVILGDAEQAAVHFRRALAIPSWISRHALRADPLLAPLRGHPEFERLIAGER